MHTPVHSRASRCAKRLCLALLLGAFSLAVSAQQVEQQSGHEAAAVDAHLDCTALDQQPAPQSGREWLERSLWAGHCRIYQARAVRVGVDGIRTLALSHEVRDGAEREVLRFLDGDPLTFERRGSSVAVIHGAQGPVPASPDAIIQHLDARYRFQLASDKRIAGRSAVRVDIEPRDDYRYGRRLWLDTETALPLKQELLDERSRVVETFQLVELDDVRLHQGSIALVPGPLPAVEKWRPGWLPPGFDIQPVMTSSTASDIAHRIYGDGLATLSLFIEPLRGQPSLKPGLHRLGVSQAVVLQRHVDGQPYQIMAMGELPPKVLRRVAQGVEWDGEPVSTANDSNKTTDSG